MKMKYKLYIVIFMVMCILPFAGMAVAKTETTTENRTMAAFPSFMEEGKWNVNYLQDLGAYFEDHYAFRNLLVSVDSQIQAKLFKTSNMDTVIVGKNDWLYYTASLDNYLGQNLMSDQEVYNAAYNLSIVQEYVQSRGAKFLVTVPPNKNSLYGKNMPYYDQPKVSSERNYTNIIKALKSNKVAYTDLYQLFSNKKETLYLKRDSHWNEKGSLLAYNALLTDLNKEHELYETVPVLRTKTEIGDLNKMIYPMWSQPEWNYDYQYKKNYAYTSDTKSVEDAYITTTNKKAQGSLLMFRDSFGNTLLPWMAQSYEKAVFSKEMPYPLEKYMQESKADTVIIEKVERNLKDFITDPPMLTPSETKLSGEAKQVETKTTVHVGVSEADTAYTEVYGKLDSKYVTPGMKVYIAVGEDSDQHIYQAYLVNAASSDDSLDTTTTQYRLYLPQETVDTKTKVQVYVESEQGLYLVGQSLKGE